MNEVMRFSSKKEEVKLACKLCATTTLHTLRFEIICLAKVIYLVSIFYFKFLLPVI